MKEKPPVMSDKDIEKFMLELYNRPVLLVRLAKFVIQIARQETGAELMGKLIEEGVDRVLVGESWWKELKTKYPSKTERV